jgi:hypothetical protein
MLARPLVFNDAKDDLPGSVLVQAALEGFSGICEGKHFVDGRAENAAIDKLGKMHKLVSIWLNDEVDGANPFRGRDLGRRLLGEGDESSAGAQHGG